MKAEIARRRAKDFTTTHDWAVAVAVLIIKTMVKAMGGNPNNVTVEYRIPNASKNNPGKNHGKVDIIHVDEASGIVYVWEVKIGTYKSAQNTKEVRDYIEYLKKQSRYNGYDIRPGFALAIPPIGVIVPGPFPGQLIRVYNGGTPGAIHYDD